MKKVINDTKAPAAVGTYSQGVEYNGVYYFSGQIGINPETSITFLLESLNLLN